MVGINADLGNYVMVAVAKADGRNVERLGRA